MIVSVALAPVLNHLFPPGRVVLVAAAFLLAVGVFSFLSVLGETARRRAPAPARRPDGATT